MSLRGLLGVGKRFEKLGMVVGLSLATALIGILPLSAPAFADEQSGDLLAGTSSALVAQSDDEPATVEMQRLYNPNSGEHFYTANIEERDNLVKLGWNYEGVGWTAPTSSGTPVYRLYNKYGGEHHYTTSASERDFLVKAGWNDEGIGWYSVDSGPRLGLYRDYNPNAYANNHNYTTGMDEHANLATVGWRSEGAGWYGVLPADFKKGWLLDAGWEYWSGGKRLTGSWVVATSPPPALTAGSAAGLQRYWIDAEGFVAVSRLVDPGASNDAAAGYLAYARPSGQIVRGKYDNLAGRVYLADNDGRLATGSGWLVTAAYDGALQRYYIDGVMHAAVSGSFEVDGKKYWGIGGQGYVARNQRLQVDGSWMRADNDGVLTTDAAVERLRLMAQGYSSPSPYLIMVDIDDPVTVVFEGSAGNWKVKYAWDCSTGAPDSPTVEGVFSVGMKGYSFGEGHGYSCYYWTQFYGDYLFHTRKYYANTHNVMDGRMNQRVSEGCVRLYDEDAIWIQDNVPAGTTVVTTY